MNILFNFSLKKEKKRKTEIEDAKIVSNVKHTPSLSCSSILCPAFALDGMIAKKCAFIFPYNIIQNWDKNRES